MSPLTTDQLASFYAAAVEQRDNDPGTVGSVPLLWPGEPQRDDDSGMAGSEATVRPSKSDESIQKSELFSSEGSREFKLQAGAFSRDWEKYVKERFDQDGC